MVKWFMNEAGNCIECEITEGGLTILTSETSQYVYDSFSDAMNALREAGYYEI